MEFPVLLDMKVPEVYTYSIYSAIAEKFEAFVSLGLANGRYKDFYDIYVLANNWELNGNDLKNAVAETFNHRRTSFDDIAAFEPSFTQNIIHQNRWNAFIKKKKALVQVNFEEAISLIKALLIPTANAIRSSTSFDKKWNPQAKDWS